MTSLKHSGDVWLGLDLHKDSIAAGVLGTQESSPRIELIGPGPDAVRRLIKKVSGSPERVRRMPGGCGCTRPACACQISRERSSMAVAVTSTAL